MMIKIKMIYSHDNHYSFSDRSVTLDKLLLYFTGTELILLLCCYLLYSLSKKTIKSVILHVLVYIIGGVPLIYMTLEDLNSFRLDANIGLGLVFMYTWAFSGIAFVIFIIKRISKNRKTK